MRINTSPTDHLPEDFTVESLRSGGLTDQEIEALAAGDDPLVTMEAAQPAVAEEPEPPALGQPPVAAPAAVPVATLYDLPIAEIPPPMIPDIPVTTEAEAVLKNAEADLEALTERYDNGDMTRAEFMAEHKALVKKHADAEKVISTAADAIRQADAVVLKHWKDTLEAYEPLAPGLWSPDLKPGWNDHLMKVTGDPGYSDLTRLQQIQVAHANYLVDLKSHGRAIPADAAIPTASKAAAAQRPKIERRTDDRPEAPQTLAGANSDTTSEIEDSGFSVIDREIMRDPIRAEQMLDRLTPEQRDRYLMEV